jgi:hypothetical protein
LFLFSRITELYKIDNLFGFNGGKSSAAAHVRDLLRFSRISQRLCWMKKSATEMPNAVLLQSSKQTFTSHNFKITFYFLASSVDLLISFVLLCNAVLFDV